MSKLESKSLEEVRRRVAEKSRATIPPPKVEDLSYIEDEIDEAVALHKRMKQKAFNDNRWESMTLDMLTPLKQTCNSCIMCELGRKSLGFNRHVFSNMNPSKWVIVGQNPGKNECDQDEPFVGKSGQFFNEVLEDNGINREYFYISNAVKCFTEGNEKPSQLIMDRCEPYLRMELQILRPHLVVALGSVAFGALCPKMKFTPNLGKVIKSAKFGGVKVFPIYHPSPMNTSNKDRKARFIKDLAMLCKIIKKF